jgi:hypothetical protein
VRPLFFDETVGAGGQNFQHLTHYDIFGIFEKIKQMVYSIGLRFIRVTLYHSLLHKINGLQYWVALYTVHPASLTSS